MNATEEVATRLVTWSGFAVLGVFVLLLIGFLIKPQSTPRQPITQPTATIRLKQHRHHKKWKSKFVHKETTHRDSDDSEID